MIIKNMNNNESNKIIIRVINYYIFSLLLFAVFSYFLRSSHIIYVHYERDGDCATAIFIAAYTNEGMMDQLLLFIILKDS